MFRHDPIIVILEVAYLPPVTRTPLRKLVLVVHALETLAKRKMPSSPYTLRIAPPP